jgi:hypothetical protein
MARGMKKASEYRDHARECRKLAQGMRDAKREQTLALAEVWDKLAADREERDKRQKDPGCGKPVTIR